MHEELRRRYDALIGRVDEACRRAGRSREEVRVVVVTKTHPVETVQAVVDLGIRDIGENRVQEVTRKAPQLHGEYRLHLVGHLQTNKVGKALPLVRWIQSVDRPRLVDKIEERFDGGEPLQALVQVNTSGEGSKWGCSPEQCAALCERVANAPSLRFRGLMTIGPLGGSEKQIRGSFRLLRQLGEQAKGSSEERLELSMGMSDDFEWAIEEGATMIRVGSLLLGRRNER